MLTHLVKQFTAIYEGEPWFGDSFQEKLKDITPEQAFTRPLPQIHCIAELISHCIYWRAPLIKRLQNDLIYKASMEDEANWLPIEKLKAKGWNALLAEWEACQKELIKLLSHAPPSFVKEPYRHGHTMDHLIEGVLQHDIYHLGQIGLVKGMLHYSN